MAILGFLFSKTEINISDHTFEKLKKKIRRKGRSIYRWRCKTGATYKSALKVYIRYFNKKFYYL